MIIAGRVAAQPQYPFPYPPGMPVVAPLLYVRILGPAGMKATFYRGHGIPQAVTVPFTVGLRPGYTYRLALSQILGYPGLSLYPSLEVRGSLLLANRLRNPDFPVALVFRDEDFAGARAGSLITKVVVLERPDVAIPRASKADDPVQIDVPPNRDPMQEARLRGHPLLLFRMGELQVSPKDLASQSVSGSVLLPGEKVLPLPRVPPWVPWECWPVHDPILGPPDSADHITIHQGGDMGLKAGIDPFGKVRGLDPSDTVAQYTDSRGRTRLAVSNRLGLCVPRFLVVRGEAMTAGRLARIGLGDTRNVQGGQVYHSQQALLERHQNQQLGAMDAGQRLSSSVNSEGTVAVGRAEGLAVFARADQTGSVKGRQPPPQPAELPDKPLRIIKWPDKCGGLIGEVITFHIRFSNVGGKPISNVVVSDSLAGRFEYLPGTAQTDRPAVFTTQPNDAGSTVLRWEFQDTLQPGESGLLRFQVRIR